MAGNLSIEKAFGGFSVNDIDTARTFYRDTLGINTSKTMGVLVLEINDRNKMIVYPKPDHQPATFTVLNFPVTDIHTAVDELTSKGIRFEQYEGDIKTNEKGIHEGVGPMIAWFKDPSGNILSILQENT